MEYLYGNLNKLVELQKYNFISSDSTINVITATDTNEVDLGVNTSQLVTLKKIDKIDGTPGINYYKLFAYNASTKLFDIPIGDEITTGIANIDISAFDSAWVKIGEYQKMEPILDEFGNPTFDIETGIQLMEPVYDKDGNPVMVPLYHKIEVSISESGGLILDRIPISAITDNMGVDAAGQVQYIQSTIDGNFGGIVY